MCIDDEEGIREKILGTIIAYTTKKEKMSGYDMT